LTSVIEPRGIAVVSVAVGAAGAAFAGRFRRTRRESESPHAGFVHDDDRPSRSAACGTSLLAIVGDAIQMPLRPRIITRRLSRQKVEGASAICDARPNRSRSSFRHCSRNDAGTMMSTRTVVVADVLGDDEARLIVCRARRRRRPAHASHLSAIAAPAGEVMRQQIDARVDRRRDGLFAATV
jgi:hypothetical protein